MKKTPKLPFSIEELDYHTHYLGMNTNGTFIWFDEVTGSVYRWNPKTGYFRRNSSWTMDGRNTLVTKKKLHKMDVDTFDHYIRTYRKTVRRYSSNKGGM